MSIYLGRNKIGITKYENLNPELTEQETLLNKLEEDVNALSDKPVDKLQLKCDTVKSLSSEFYDTPGSDMSNDKVIELMKGIDTSKVATMNFMFGTGTNPRFLYSDLSSITLDCSNCITLAGMFTGQQALKKLPTILNTGNVTDMNKMFYYCDSLTEIAAYDTKSVKDFSNMFYKNLGLEGDIVVPYNTDSGTRFESMFKSCSNIIKLDLSSFNTQNVTTMYGMFDSCYKLQTIIGNLDLIKVTSITSMFANCRALENITLKNIQVNLQIGSGTTWGHLLSDESLINTFKELWDYSGTTKTRTLTLSTTSKNNIANIYVKLIEVTADMRAEDEYIDNKKPCVVCESTDEGAMTLTEYAISKNWAIA